MKTIKTGQQKEKRRKNRRRGKIEKEKEYEKEKEKEKEEKEKEEGYTSTQLRTSSRPSLAAPVPMSLKELKSVTGSPSFSFFLHSFISSTRRMFPLLPAHLRKLKLNARLQEMRCIS